MKEGESDSYFSLEVHKFKSQIYKEALTWPTLDVEEVLEDWRLVKKNLASMQICLVGGLMKWVDY